MHMRKKKWSRPELAACPYYYAEPAQLRNAWRGCFPCPDHPFHVELGCGKGVSTAQMMHAETGTNFLAIDISPDVLGCTRRNIEDAFGEAEVTNAALTRCDIEHIENFIGPDDRVDRIIISFCNPWNARPRQHRRRLTHPRQLMQYRAFLQDGGEIWFKTDDEQLYRQSLQYFEACGFELRYRTDDLHASGFAPNYMSEHELKYSAAGIPIRFAIVRKLPGEVTIDPLFLSIWHMASDEEDAEQETEENLEKNPEIDSNEEEQA